MAKKITHSLFGELKGEAIFGWSGEIRLRFFSPFDTRARDIVDRRSRRRHKLPQRIRLPRELKSTRRRKNGWFHLQLMTDDSAPFNGTLERPSADQEQAFRFLIDNERRVGNAVVKAIIAAYPAFRDSYRCDIFNISPSRADDDDLVPKTISRKKLQDLICLSGVLVHWSGQHGFALVGFAFDCTWEEEHALGVLTHKDKVLDVGQADIAS